jgi:hypothetical protein
MIHEKELLEIEERCNDATSGPWTIESHNYIEIISEAEDYSIAEVSCFESHLDTGNANADFIANSRTDIPNLIVEVRRLQEGLKIMLEYDQACKKILSEIGIGCIGRPMPERCRDVVELVQNYEKLVGEDK